MRIALAHSHANTFGGGERAVLELARQLSDRHAVQLLLGGFDVSRTYPDLATFPLRRISRAAWPFSAVTADVIVANSFGSNLLALRNADRVAYWVHSLRSIFLQPSARRPDLLARRALDFLAVRRARLLIANSHFAASKLQRLYRRRPDAVVYPGVDLDLFTPGTGEGGFAITVGRLAPEKGLDRLFELWRELADVPLHVIGGGPVEVEAELRRAAPANVTFRGTVSPSALAEVMRRAAVAVFAPYGEEFGIAPLEAMASGVPVVAWRDGGLVETVVDGQTGFLASDSVTFRQRVRLIAHDANRRRTLGAAARARAEMFSWRRTAAEIEALCWRLAGPTPPGAAPRA